MPWAAQDKVALPAKYEGARSFRSSLQLQAQAAAMVSVVRESSRFAPRSSAGLAGTVPSSALGRSHSRLNPDIANLSGSALAFSPAAESQRLPPATRTRT